MQAVRSKKYEAFPGDRYIANLEIAAKASKPWVRVLWVAVLISACADFYIVWDLLAQLLEWTDPSDVLAGLRYGVFDLEGPFVVCALVASYIFLGRVVGKKAAEYKAFRAKSSFAIASIAFVFDCLMLVVVTILRFFSEIKKVLNLSADGANDEAFGEAVLDALTAFSSGGIGGFFESLGPVAVIAVMNALSLALVMVLGAALSMIASYYGSDPVASEKLCDAKSSLHQDSQVYEKVYFQYAADPEKDRRYEEQEQRLDEEMIGAVLQLSSLASQLNGVLDPADAQEFRQASSIVSRNWFHADPQEA